MLWPTVIGHKKRSHYGATMGHCWSRLVPHNLRKLGVGMGANVVNSIGNRCDFVRGLVRHGEDKLLFESHHDLCWCCESWKVNTHVKWVSNHTIVGDDGDIEFRMLG